MNAAVVIPAIKDFYFTYHRFACLGAVILKKILESHYINVSYYIFPLSVKKSKVITLPDELLYLKPFIIPGETGPISFFTKYKYFGPEPGVCAERILRNSPDIIFLSCFSFCYADETILLAEKIKESSDTAIIAGGAGVCAWPEYFIKEKSIDFCITGEAEISVPLFLKKLFLRKMKRRHNFKEIPNLYFKENNNIIVPEAFKYSTADDLIFVLAKTHETKKIIFYSTYLSRGCPKKCSFCTNHLSHGRLFRTIPLHIIEQELIKAKTQNSGKQVYINFEDDNILFCPGYFIKVLKLFKKYFKESLFLLENGIDYTRLNNNLLKTLISLGLNKLNISLASTSEYILKKENRTLNLSKYEKILKTAKENNVPVTSYFICGFKHDTKESIAESLAYLYKLPTELGISMFYAVPGLKGFTDKTLFKSPCLCAGSSAYPWNNSLSTKTMVTAFRLSRFINELKRNTSISVPLLQNILKDKVLYTLIKDKKKKKMVPVENIDSELVKLFFTRMTT